MKDREARKRQKIDYLRPLRVVKYIDFSFVLENSPVEIIDGYIVSDRDTCDVFASFVFKNVTIKRLSSLTIRLSLYQNQNIPYQHIDFTYSQSDLNFGIISVGGRDLRLRESNKRTSVSCGETFGSCVFIPIPERYFTKMDVVLVSAEFADGEKLVMNKLVTGHTKRFSELDEISRVVYSRVNIYQSAEEKYPTRVIPQFGDNVWLCCCGTKNPSDLKYCEKCNRERDWQKESVTADAIEALRATVASDPRERNLHDKSKYAQNKFLESSDEIQLKIDQYEKAMKNIALDEKMKHKRQMMLIPKIIVAILIIYLLTFLLKILAEFQIPEAESALINVMRFVDSSLI